MDQPDQQTDKKRTIQAPQPHHAVTPSSVISVELKENEEVEWQWTHFPDRRSAVTGYTITRKNNKPE